MNNRENVNLSPDVTFITKYSCLSSKRYGDVYLTSNENQLLNLLSNEVYKKEVIIKEIWGRKGIVVSDSSYHQLIKMLRRKLKRSGLPTDIIKTIRGYGIILIPIKKQINEDVWLCRIKASLHNMLFFLLSC